jgi:GNAT superfamily N-acetyltransferase
MHPSRSIGTTDTTGHAGASVQGVTTSLEVRPVGLGEVDALEQLFASERNTRHCWCMSFCTSRTQFAAGWFGGGNRRRFEMMASGNTPMGVIALLGEAPVGWGACGPRSRYLGTDPARHPLLGGRSRTEDDTVWLLPCLFVHAGHRAQGVSHALVEAAGSLARRQGAVAIEGWPLSSSQSRRADAFVGREQLFAELDFGCVERPVPTRAIMRLDLVAA